MSEIFRLPKDGVIYTEAIFNRCRDLIAYNVWDGLERLRLDAWITNFQTQEETYFAAKVLDALIYRSDSQTVALMQQLFQRTIPDLQRQKKISTTLSKIYTSLRENIEPGIRVVPIIPPGESPTKSGPAVARNLRRGLHFSSRWFVNPELVPSTLSKGHVVIFFDDFLGTGSQFIEFIQEANLEDSIKSGRCLYTPLVGHKDGIQKLRNEFPELSVGVVEKLDDNHALFHNDAISFPDSENTTELARNFYYDLLEKYGINLGGRDRRGFGCFELVYAFEHAVPDNSLPILWWEDSSNNWKSLFTR